jgi:hypothetical protein
LPYIKAGWLKISPPEKPLAPHCDWMLLWFVLDHEALYEVWVDNSIKYTNVCCVVRSNIIPFSKDRRPDLKRDERKTPIVM